MRLFFITSGSGNFLSHLDPDIIDGLRKVQLRKKDFRFAVFRMGKEPLNGLPVRIRTFRPDVILVFIGKHPRLRGYAGPQLRRFGVPVGLWVVDDPYDLQRSQQLARLYDFALTQEESCVPFYRRQGKPCFHMPLGVNPARYRHLENVPATYQSDVCFIGNAFPSRIRLIDEIAPFLQNKRFLLMGKWWDRLHNFQQLTGQIVNRWIPHEQSVRYYNGAKIVLNLHAVPDESVGGSNRNHRRLPANTPNNRTFEIAACRTFQLATSRPGFNRLFSLGREMVCYRDAADLQRKIHHYLTHPAEREGIAAGAYRRTIRNHTYFVRLYNLVQTLERSRLVKG